jgi:hypothetical protein
MSAMGRPLPPAETRGKRSLVSLPNDQEKWRQNREYAVLRRLFTVFAACFAVGMIYFALERAHSVELAALVGLALLFGMFVLARKSNGH